MPPERSGRRQDSGVDILPPATLAGVNRLVVLGIVALRVGAVAQLVVAFASGSLAHAAVPWLSAAAAVLLVVESSVTCTLWWRGGRASRPGLVAVDIATLSLLYALQLVFASDASRAVTWEGWVVGIDVGFLVAVACLPTWRSTSLAGAFVVGGYWLTVLPDALARDQAATVLASGSGLVVDIVGMRLIWVLLSRLGARADDEAAAAQRARELLVSQNQRIVHELHSQTGNVVALLRDLEPARLDGSPREVELLAEALWSSATRARAALVGGPEGEEVSGTLGATLRDSARRCHTLQVTCTTYQVDALRLPDETLGAISRAVTTVLENVAHHSGTREATVYAGIDGDSFEVTVTDAGVGFDPASAHWGVGLATIAGSHLAEHQLHPSIRSAPGLGTTVTITGSCAPRGSQQLQEQR